MKKRVIRVAQQESGLKPTKRNGKYGQEMVGRIETTYEFYNVEQFIDIFQPTKISEGLINAIAKAFNDFGSVVFNTGNGNQTFYFQES